MIVILTQNVVNSVACVVTHLNGNMAVEKRCIVMISQLHVLSVLYYILRQNAVYSG